METHIRYHNFKLKLFVTESGVIFIILTLLG